MNRIEENKLLDEKHTLERLLRTTPDTLDPHTQNLKLLWEDKITNIDAQLQEG